MTQILAKNQNQLICIDFGDKGVYFDLKYCKKILKHIRLGCKIVESGVRMIVREHFLT